LAKTATIFDIFISRPSLMVDSYRLILEPVTEMHASEMVGILQDESVHEFIPSNPPSLNGLRDQYRKWESRRSPDKSELWLNWVARLKSNQSVCGHFQAGVNLDQDVTLAWIVGVPFQGQGLATEALMAIMEFLNSRLQPREYKAWIDTRNFPSLALAKKLGMSQIHYLEKADHFKGQDSHEYVFSKKINCPSKID
jgi:[ribosomal protein S5]-alanine N-acetyltransferase